MLITTTQYATSLQLANAGFRVTFGTWNVLHAVCREQWKGLDDLDGLDIEPGTERHFILYSWLSLLLGHVLNSF